MQLDLKFIDMEDIWKDTTTPLLEGEIWKDVKGYEGLYMVSSYGRVKSLQREVIRSNGGMQVYPEKIRKQYKQPNGYMTVSLSKDGYTQVSYVHHLIMLTFVGEREEGMEIDHKDNNRANNRVSNLWYCSRFDNLNNPNSITSKVRGIAQYKLNGEYIKTWECARFIEYELGFSHINILRCCHGVLKSSHDYQWKFLNEDGSIPIVKKTTYRNKKVISQYTLQGEHIRNWESTMEINRQLGFDPSCITKCCKGKLNYFKGYQWRYLNEDGTVPVIKKTTVRKKAISQYTLQGEHIRDWESGAEINKQLGFSYGNIAYCCKGKFKQCYGFIWRFV